MGWLLLGEAHDHRAAAPSQHDRLAGLGAERAHRRSGEVGEREPLSREPRERQYPHTQTVTGAVGRFLDEAGAREALEIPVGGRATDPELGDHLGAGEGGAGLVEEQEDVQRLWVP